MDIIIILVTLAYFLLQVMPIQTQCANQLYALYVGMTDNVIILAVPFCELTCIFAVLSLIMYDTHTLLKECAHAK